MSSQTSDVPGLSEQNYFLIRRLHSLSGLVPLGVFLFVHLLTNATILGGAGAFQAAVGRIHAMEPFLIPIEIVGIFIPLAFHIIVGFLIAFSGRPNPQAYPYGPNIRYTLQRITAYIAFVFVLYHLYQMHWLGKPLGGAAFAYEHDPASTTAATSTADALKSAMWIAPFYAVGIVATVFHLANGIWTSLITWGITIKPRTQRFSGYACAVFGVLLTVVGLGALLGFRTLDENTTARVPANDTPTTSLVADQQEDG